MIVVDTNFLVLLIDPQSTQNENRRPERVSYFIESLIKSPREILVPAPSIAELVAGRADRIDEIVSALKAVRLISIQPFDEVTAIETGDRIAFAIKNTPAHDRPPNWKVAMKYDAMIAATAIVRGASALYTTDNGFAKYLNGSSVEVVMIDDLPLPPEDPQGMLPV